MSAQDIKGMQALYTDWMQVWYKALTLWSPYTRLKDPVLCRDSKEEQKEGAVNTLAMIRLNDLQVVVSLPEVHRFNLGEFALEILAHEIGHHVYCPANLSDQGRMIARIQRGLPGREQMSSLVANLYSDLLINDRLFKIYNLRIDTIYQRINAGPKEDEKDAPKKKGTAGEKKTAKKPVEQQEDKIWTFYMRIYEILWSLPRGTLTGAKVTDEMEADAMLGNRLVRNFSDDWLKGAGRFAALCYPYLVSDNTRKQKGKLGTWLDTMEVGSGDELPAGLIEVEDGELTDCMHPSLDEEVGGLNDEDGTQKTKRPTKPAEKQSRNNYREPFEYGQILKRMGYTINDKEIAIQYYREMALPHLIPFPTSKIPQATDPLPEGLTTWDIGSPMEKINWIETVIRSPVVIPGYTVYEQVYGTTQGSEPAKEPVDLDLYVDCSGSMPNPTSNISYLTLAAAIISLSALRCGSRVQATLWSGTRQFSVTKGFVSNEREILGIMTGFYGGGTAFPIHILRDTYANRKPTDRKVHILVISDEGVTTMFEKDEKGNHGEDVARTALEKGGGGGTFVLNLWGSWRDDAQLRMANKMGWDIYKIGDWSDLVQFSRDFVKKQYSEK